MDVIPEKGQAGPLLLDAVQVFLISEEITFACPSSSTALRVRKLTTLGLRNCVLSTTFINK